MSGADEDDREDLTQNDDPEPFDQDPEDEEDATATIECPYCGEEIFESAEFCHHCGKYVSQEDTARKQPRWYYIGVIVCVLLMLLVGIGLVKIYLLP